MKLTGEQLVEAIERYATEGLQSLAPRYGVSVTTLRGRLLDAGVVLRPVGYHLTPRTNEYATAETWQCVNCGRKASDGVRLPQAVRNSYCLDCHAARQQGAKAATQRERERYRPLVEAVERYEAAWQRVLDSVQSGKLNIDAASCNERNLLRVALFDALAELNKD